MGGAHVAHNDTILELATSAALRLRSCLMVAVSCEHREGQRKSSSRVDACVVHSVSVFHVAGLNVPEGGNVYQAQKAIMNPNQEKKNTRPYMLMGLKKGIDRAFRLIRFTSGADQRSESLSPMVACLSTGWVETDKKLSTAGGWLWLRGGKDFSLLRSEKSQCLE